MDELKNKFIQLKKTLSDQSEESKKLNEQFKRIVSEVFNDQKTPEKYIRDFYLRSGNLVVFTKNKTFANELFLRKESILASLSKEDNKEISDLIIK
jgi:chaperonin cofactor prefoldin